LTGPSTRAGFGTVLTNPDFRSLWGAQLLAQTSAQAINYVQIVLVEELTRSALATGVVILAFTLPGVIFSPVAGVVVDRLSKKLVLVISNASRLVLALGYVAVLAMLHGAWEVMAIYALSFVMASLAQFFYPAEGATIPLLVGEAHLLPANSLYNLTMVVSQVVGLIVLGPLLVELASIGGGMAHLEGGFLVLALFYLGATVLVSRIPNDRPGLQPASSSASGWRAVWQEAREGWDFVSHHERVKLATGHMVMVNTLVMVLAMIAPGFAARVLGIGTQNAVIVFAPAALGMLLATGVVGRWGQRLRRLNLADYGLGVAGLAFVGWGVVCLDYQRLMQPILNVYPNLTFSLTSATMVIAFIMGLSLSGVNILAQTIIQEDSPAHVRGRVFATLFMLNALVGIPPMLVLGEAADRIGIPWVLIIAGLLTVLIGLAVRADVWRPWLADRLGQRPVGGNQAAQAARRSAGRRRTE
jgi:MFS family permease